MPAPIIYFAIVGLSSLAARLAVKKVLKPKIVKQNKQKVKETCEKSSKQKCSGDSGIIGGKPSKFSLRKKYQKEVNDLKLKADKMKKEGLSPEQISRQLHKDRRELGVKYKNLTSKDELQKIYARNLEKYDDKLGPTIEWLRKKGKTWDQIIESATRTGGKDLGY